MVDSIRNDNDILDKERRGKDFSDTVQGEELEFRKSTQDNFPIKHKITLLGKYSPPHILSKFSPDQLVMMSGAASGFLAGVVVCPLDVVKTRAQAQGSKKSYFKTFKGIVENEGFRGLYRGLVPITIGYLPTWTIYFAVYEKTKKFYPQFFKNNFNIENEFLDHFFSAITAGLSSSIAVNPIWVVKTRLMIQSTRSKEGLNQFKQTYYNGTVDAFKKMYKEEGLSVFYSGLVPSLFGLIHVGIHFPVYEKLKEVFNCNITDSTTNLHQNGILSRLLIASTLSKMTASTITYPHEILRTRLQMQHLPHHKEKHGIIDVGKEIYKKEGIRGFYAGYGVNLMRTIPASAVTLVSFEYFKTYLLEISGHSKHL